MPMAGHYRAHQVQLMNKAMLDDSTRYRLLKYLTEHPDCTQRELAAAVGISLGKANYCLNALVEKGLIKAGNFRRSPNKGSYAYLLTPEGVQEKARVTVRFLQRKMEEYDALQDEIKVLRREVEGMEDVSPLQQGEGR
ncbi:MarR family EPS-associated transcriptional regulator [Acidithiobacillus acidisediminis]|uniref:MarR family EPS-associated transcriptional regulator n=1 Tax=Acidithiobacillus acidisediminis TaxID=2937799 RepID=UPI00200C9038|nr:MarR family EPS-associated transcriptional regulator [Acidithiobacillus sp. S30A2]